MIEDLDLLVILANFWTCFITLKSTVAVSFPLVFPVAGLPTFFFVSVLIWSVCLRGGIKFHSTEI